MPVAAFGCPAFVTQLDQVGDHAAERRLPQLGPEVGINLRDERLRGRRAASQRRHDLLFADSAMRDVARDHARRIVDGSSVSGQQPVRPEREHAIERLQVGCEISTSPARNHDRGACDDEITAEERSTFGLV